MAVVCIVDRDSKSINEMISFIKSSELDLEIHSFASLEAFVAATHLFSATPKQQKVVAKIDVLIFDYEACAKIEEDIKKIRRGLEVQQLQNEFPTRLLLTSFEGVKVPVYNLKVEDYIFKPLEKQLFLQKLEIAVSAPEKVDPSYLALQPIKEKIEVGKKSTLAYFSDFCLTINNPGPLHEGAFVRFYSKRFGENQVQKILGRSLESRKATEGYLCRFDYFGLNHDRQTVLRKRFAELKEGREPLIIPEVKATDKPQVVIIDIDKNESQSLKQYLEENVDIDVLHFPSYTRFLVSCFPSEDSKPKTEAAELVIKPARQGNFAFSIELNEELEMLKLNWAESPKKVDKSKVVKKEGEEQEEVEVDEMFLTHLKTDWESKPDLFMKSIDPGHNENVKDFLDIVWKAGGKHTDKFIFVHSDGARSLLQISVEKLKDSYLITISDKTDEEKTYDYKNLGIGKVNLTKIDLLIIDENYILDSALWLEGMTNKVQTLANKQMPKIIVLGKTNVPPPRFLRKDFSDYMHKPIDKALLGKKLLGSYQLGITNLKMQQLDIKNLEHVALNESIMLATEIDMLSLSEFGIAVRFGSPIRQDMFIQFYLKSFLGMDNHEPIYARCYFSEEDREFQGKYICYFTFLGVSDDIFKAIRLWVRDYYIKSKDASE